MKKKPPARPFLQTHQIFWTNDSNGANGAVNTSEEEEDGQI